MATKRKERLVLGLFEDKGALAKLLTQRRGWASFGRAFVFANELQQQEIEELLADPFSIRKQNFRLLLAKQRGNPSRHHLLSSGRMAAIPNKGGGRTQSLSTEYNVKLPDNHIVVAVNSPRASEYGKLFRRLGAIEVFHGVIPHVISSVAQSTLSPYVLMDIVQRMVPGKAYARAIGAAAAVSLPPLNGPASITFSDENEALDFSFDEAGTMKFSSGDRPKLASEDRADLTELAPVHPPSAATPPAPVPRSPESYFEIGAEAIEKLPPNLPSGTSEPDGSIERFIEGRFPPSVSPWEKCNLEIRIAVESEGGTKSTRVNAGVLPNGQDAEVLLLLHAPDFVIGGDQRARTIIVPAKKSSEFAMWELTPNRTGNLSLSITAYYGSSPLGELKIETNVMTGVATGSSVTTNSVVQFETPDPGQITLVIHFDPDNQVYTCTFVSTGFHSEDIKSGALKRPPDEVINSLIAQLNAMAKGTTKIDPGEMRDWLRGKGLDLWLEFIPEKLQTLFWQQRGNIKRLRILSGGDPVPWELLYPTEPGGSPDPATGFLGESFDLTRWRFGRSPMSRIRSGRTCFVLPPNPPKQAVAEVDMLEGIVGGDSIRVDSLKKLREILQSSEFGILHFACHNSFDKTTARINMADGPLEPSTLRNYLNKFDNPFIFMNACRTDGQTQSYTRLGGWASSFLDTGVGAFVGSLWEIRDESAAKFASTLYSQLKTQSLGEAIAAARKSINTDDGDPTWLAYSVYGSFAARLSN